MTSSLVKCKQVFGRALLDVLQQFAYLCDFLQYANALTVKERRQAIYFNEQKTLPLILKTKTLTSALEIENKAAVSGINQQQDHTRLVL